MTSAELIDVLWRDYVAKAPQAEEIRSVLTGRGEILCNDHVALRTFALPGIGGCALARPFETLGWRPRERYEFPRGVRARAWRHDDPALPGILISELAVDALSPRAQAVIDALIDQLPEGFGARSDLAWAGRPWRMRSARGSRPATGTDRRASGWATGPTRRGAR